MRGRAGRGVGASTLGEAKKGPTLGGPPMATHYAKKHQHGGRKQFLVGTQVGGDVDGQGGGANELASKPTHGAPLQHRFFGRGNLPCLSNLLSFSEGLQCFNESFNSERL